MKSGKYRAGIGARNLPGIPGKESFRHFRLRSLPGIAPFREVALAHFELDRIGVDVDRDRVAFLDEGDRSADCRFGLIGRLFEEGTVARAGLALERAVKVSEERPAGF